MVIADVHGSPGEASSSPTVIPLAHCSADLADQVGGKARGLHDLIELRLPVPEGFAVTVEAYRDAVTESGLEARIAELLADEALDDARKSARIQELFTSVELPGALDEALEKGYAQLGGGPVAVRSSGVAEDTAEASFAGQHDTYLWVVGIDALRTQVRRCWASLYNAGAIGYRARWAIPPSQVAMGVVVQRMVEAAAGGVMMTLEPVTGERDRVTIESAFGLGEGVVGDVHTDRFWVAKDGLTELGRQVNEQTRQHVFDEQAGGVVLGPLDPALGARPSLDDEQVLELARLGLRIEEAFGRPMDIEWAVSGDGRPALLQARPETVWSNRPDSAGTTTPTGPTTMHGELDPDQYYTTANLGEAAPGVLAPLTWSVWGPAAEIAARYGFVQMGVLERSQAGMPEDPRRRIIQIAFGRAVASVSSFYEMGERIPGASGDMLAEQLLGEVPDGMVSNPTIRRLPHVAWNMPRNFLRAKRVLVRQNREITVWWAHELTRTPRLGLASAQSQFEDAARRFRWATALQGQGNILRVPPVFDALRKLVDEVGMEDSFGRLTAGGGDHFETEVVADLWDMSRGRLDEAEFLRRHGYHGTMEGDIAGTVWREDPTPVRRLAELYRRQSTDKNPRALALQRQAERAAAEAELLSRMSGRAGRARAALVLRLARNTMPMRGIGKSSFLRSLDIARAAARRIGGLLVADGRLEDVDDVMYLTAAEITRSIPANARELVAQRRAEQARYRTYELPVAFWGCPTPRTATTATDEPAVAELTGVGASAGVVEGSARVVTDPSFAQVEPGEVLVAATTDPSWASIMFLSAALVVDIGGTLSHAAVVARELGILCVVNTSTGTGVLRTGDRVRVDGSTGVVSIIERAR